MARQTGGEEGVRGLLVNDETSIARLIAQIEMDKRRDRSEEMERNRKVRPRKRKGEERKARGG